MQVRIFYITHARTHARIIYPLSVTHHSHTHARTNSPTHDPHTHHYSLPLSHHARTHGRTRHAHTHARTQSVTHSSSTHSLHHTHTQSPNPPLTHSLKQPKHISLLHSTSVCEVRHTSICSSFIKIRLLFYRCHDNCKKYKDVFDEDDESVRQKCLNWCINKERVPQYNNARCAHESGTCICTRTKLPDQE